MYSRVILLCFAYFSTTTALQATDIPLPNIGIIGGGIGGSSASHFLRELVGPDVSIDVYEAASEAGGRVATVDIAGRTYECGGSIIHPANAYMVNFTEMLGLRQRDKGGGGAMVIYDGEEIAFQTSDHFVFMLAKMLWRYGMSPIKLERLVSHFLGIFSRIYKTQEDGVAFTTLEQLIASMDHSFLLILHKTLTAELELSGIDETFVKEFAAAALRANYGQEPEDVQSLVGMVSLAGVQPGLWSVQGGNKLIAQKLLEHSKVNLLLNTKVTDVTLQGRERKYGVKSVSEDGEVQEEVYDILIIAVPLHDNISEINFKKFPDNVQFSYSQNYHQTVATFVHGIVNLTQVSLDSEDECPAAVLTCNRDLFFNSIGKQTPVDHTEGSEIPSVYKVFSQVPLTSEQLDKLFISQDEVKVVDWRSAYPHYGIEKQKFPPFKLFNNLYYVNAIEMAASALEMSAIGGRNVALLAHHDWYRQSNKIDPPFIMDKPTTENEEL